MAKNNRLSHSAVSTYLSCGFKYKMHYIEKLRSTQTHAALLFGSALDKAIDAMLSDHQRNNIDYLGQAYNNVFINNWRQAEINGALQTIVDNQDIVYAATDIDFKLFQQKDYNGFMSVLQGSYPGAGQLTEPTPEAVIAVYKSILKRKESSGWENLNPDERKFYNYLNWTCMVIKGQLMIKAYLNEVLPRIKRVISTQRQITIPHPDGDSITGFVDLIAEWEDGRVVVFDNKTSARAYEDDAVLKSQQLALYSHALENELNTRYAGFIVMRKLIDKDATKKCSKCGMDGTGNRGRTCTNEIDGKRCSGEWTEVLRPKAVIQILIDKIPEQLEKNTMENFAEVNHAIKAEVFPKNFSSCQIGSWRCPYYSLCHEGKLKGLVKLEDK